MAVDRPRVALGVILALFVMVGLGLGQNPKPAPQPAAQPTQTPVNRPPEADVQKVEQLSSVVQELKTQNLVLSTELDRLRGFFYFLGSIMSFVLLVGTITSFISWNTDRKRSKETYYSVRDREAVLAKREDVLNTRNDELFSLSLKNDQESSERDRKLFAQSEETLTLVNQTLRLAKDASERASKSLQEKLDRKHNSLEQEAIELIEESRGFKNFKTLVEDSGFRSDLQTLALEIAGLENNHNILDKEVILKPTCSFIRAMNFHLDQHFKPAIKYWKNAKDHEDASVALRIAALYWIGYEQNNLGYFDKATVNFEEASGLATGALRFELERIRIESKFFTKQPIATILPEMEALHKKVEEIKDDSNELKKAYSQIAGTLGNMYFQQGNQEQDPVLREAAYTSAKNTFEKAPVKNKWTWFGYSEACFKLKDYDEAEKQLRNHVIAEAELEYSTRPEPRTKVLGQSTVLICSMRIGKLKEHVETLYSQLKITLGTVDDRLTVYSQFQRRNVAKKDFLTDLDDAMAEFRQGLQQTND